MPKGSNNIENKSEEQFIIMFKDYKQDSDEKINKYKQDSDDKMTKYRKGSDDKMTKVSEDFQTMFAVLSDQINESNRVNTISSSPTQKDTSTSPDPTTMVPDNRGDPPLEGGHSTKICGMWTLKHEISSPKFYQLFIKTELKVDTALDIKNLYNHIKLCLNAVTRIREYLRTG